MRALLRSRCAAAQSPSKVGLRRPGRAFIPVIALLCVASAGAVAKERSPALRFGEFNPEHRSVELFAGLQSGELSARLIVPDSTEARLLLENATDEPLNVELPAAFAGVPVLAQFAPGGGFPRGGNGGGVFGQGPAGGQSGGQQGIGGGFNQGNNGFNNGGFNRQGAAGGQFFNVPPERIVRLRVPAVCLNYGLREPHARAEYRIVPLEEYSVQPGVRELCLRLAAGEVDQRTAQAAAWHLNNGLSWEALAREVIDHAGGAPDEPFFSRRQLVSARDLAAECLPAGGAASVASAATERP